MFRQQVFVAVEHTYTYGAMHATLFLVRRKNCYSWGGDTLMCVAGIFSFCGKAVRIRGLVKKTQVHHYKGY